MPEKIVGDRYYVSFAELGEPKRKGAYRVPGLGLVILDDADVHYAATQPAPGFFVRRSTALGPEAFVVVSRVQTA